MTFRTGVLGLVLLVCPATVAAQVDDAVHDSAATFPTPGERKGWFAPTTPLEAATWLGELALANERLVLDTLALAPGGPSSRTRSFPFSSPWCADRPSRKSAFASSFCPGNAVTNPPVRR